METGFASATIHRSVLTEAKLASAKIQRPVVREARLASPTIQRPVVTEGRLASPKMQRPLVTDACLTSATIQRQALTGADLTSARVAELQHSVAKDPMSVSARSKNRQPWVVLECYAMSVTETSTTLSRHEWVRTIYAVIDHSQQQIIKANILCHSLVRWHYFWRTHNYMSVSVL